MIYVMSDLNGHLEEFSAMLKKLRFHKRDEMYVLGNIIDCGEDPIGLLQEMMMMENCYPILGYREYRFLKCMSKLPMDAQMKDLPDLLDEGQMALLAEWIKDGGDVTLSQYFALEPEDREAILDYLGECMPYDLVESAGKQYLLTSCGVHGYDPAGDLDDYPVKAFIGSMTREELIGWDSDTILVVGSYPVQTLPEGLEGCVYFGDSFIAINCDIAHPDNGGRLGCLRLGDERDFYVD